MDRRRGLWAGFGVLLLLGGLLLQPMMAQALLRAGQQAPSFTLQLLTGETLALDQLKGKPVVLNFWASW